MADLQATPYGYQSAGYANDLIQGLLGYMKDPQRTQQMQMLAGLLESTGVPKTVERAAYAQDAKGLVNALTNVNRANVPLLKPETAEAIMNVAPLVGPTARAAESGLIAAGRAGERYAEKVVPQIMERGGLPAQLLGDLSQGSVSRVVPDASLLGQSKAAEATDLLSYRGSHTAPGPDFGAPLHDLTGGGQMYPADVYSPKAAQYYGTGYPKADKEAFALANKVRGNPDAEVTMYRAVPKNESIKDINAGDWVTLSKEYAKNHGESVLDNDYKILSKKVKAKDLWTNADSIHEFGYWPE